MNELGNEILLLSVLQIITGLTIAACCVLAWDAMGSMTRHCFRFVYGIMGVAGLGLAVLPFAHAYIWLRPWLFVTLAVGVAIYMVLDRRRIDRIRR